MQLCNSVRLQKITNFSFLSEKLDFIEKNGIKTFIANSPINSQEVLGVFGGKVLHKSQISFNSGVIHPIDDSFCMICPQDLQELDSIYFARQSKGTANCYLESSLKLTAKTYIAEGEEICYNAKQDFTNEKFHPNAWGLLTSIDLEDCNPVFIRSSDKIKQYVWELCDLIQMKRFGDTKVVHFGEDEKVAGFSMFQLIETSCISAHFANQTNTAYIDIFSCKGYNPNLAASFTKNFFQGDNIRLHVINRF